MRRRAPTAIGILVIGAVVAIVWLVARPDPQSPVVAPGSQWRCDRTATTRAELRREFAAAAPGQTVCLAAGRYGTFRAGRKPGTVTVRPLPGDEARLALELDPAVNLRIEGLVVTAAFVGGASRNVTIAGSRFTGLAHVDAGTMTNANVVFDGNTHADVDTCPSCRQGRVHVDGDSGEPSGVVIRNSTFSGGNSDGVRADGRGVAIVDNEFAGMTSDEDPYHTDPIQIFGGRRVVIRGNHFHDNRVAAPIMMADGGARNLVEDNVIEPGGYTWAVVWHSDVGSVIRHNTFADGACDNNLRCGLIELSSREGAGRGHGTIIRDNVLGGVRNDGSAEFAADHNLSGEPLPGSANVTGLPSVRRPGGLLRGLPPRTGLARQGCGVGRARRRRQVLAHHRTTAGDSARARKRLARPPPSAGTRQTSPSMP